MEYSVVGSVLDLGSRGRVFESHYSNLRNYALNFLNKISIFYYLFFSFYKQKALCLQNKFPI